MTPRERRLQKKYGITQAERDGMERKEGGCGVCGRPAGKISLSVDHSHAVERMKIIVERIRKDWWKAYPEDVSFRTKAWSFADTRKKAKQATQLQLKRLSVRGILCWQHNVGLRKFSDNPEWLERAAAYLRRWKEGKGGLALINNQN